LLKSEDNEEKSRTKISDTYVRFIDVLFAVILGQSFALLTSEQSFKTWLNQPIENAFGIATIMLVYVLVITSWVGYHQSVEKYKIRSVWRFIIDIALLFLYYFAFVNAGKFEIVISIFFLSFLLYTIWDAFRIYEYRTSSTRELWKRFSFSGLFVVISLFVYGGYNYLCPQIPEIRWAFFIIILAILLLYRYVKWYRLKS
jgi:succinate dehydrogenase hydrophobic anchor subunit